MSTKVEELNRKARLRPRRKTILEASCKSKLRPRMDIKDLKSPINVSLENSKSLYCLFCEKKFSRHKALSSHTQSIHLKYYNSKHCLKCYICGYCSKSTDDILAHFQQNHSDDYFACFNCETRFSNKDHLTKHQAKHCSTPKKNVSIKKGTETTIQKCHVEQTNPFLNETIAICSKTRLVAEDTKKRAPVKYKKRNIGGPARIHDNQVDVICSKPKILDLDISRDKIERGDIDYEDSIATNIILPSNKNDGINLKKNAVIVLNDIHLHSDSSRKIYKFENSKLITDTKAPISQISEETYRKEYLKYVDEPRFEKCYDAIFFKNVAGNALENITRYLDGTFNERAYQCNFIKTRRARGHSTIINTIEGFPTLLSKNQYQPHANDVHARRVFIKNKWKWAYCNKGMSSSDIESWKYSLHLRTCIVGLLSRLDILSQLSIRNKFEYISLNDIPINKTSRYKINYHSEDQESMLDIKVVKLPSWLGLEVATPQKLISSDILSGECIRRRCFVCCACGFKAEDRRSLASHHALHHPNAQITLYEVVGEELLNSNIFKHLFIPPSLETTRNRSTRGSRNCSKCESLIPADQLHKHLLECAGDYKMTRRKCRYKLFNVRKRRIRLPDTAIRKKIRERLLCKKNKKRRLPKKGQVTNGEAEKVKRMIAELPAKRFRKALLPSTTKQKRLGRKKVSQECFQLSQCDSPKSTNNILNKQQLQKCRSKIMLDSKIQVRKNRVLKRHIKETNQLSSDLRHNDLNLKETKSLEIDKISFGDLKPTIGSLAVSEGCSEDTQPSSDLKDNDQDLNQCEHFLALSPTNCVKRKPRKRLNDCIAMLKNKLCLNMDSENKKFVQNTILQIPYMQSHSTDLAGEIDASSFDCISKIEDNRDKNEIIINVALNSEHLNKINISKEINEILCGLPENQRLKILNAFPKVLARTVEEFKSSDTDELNETTVQNVTTFSKNKTHTFVSCADSSSKNFELCTKSSQGDHAISNIEDNTGNQALDLTVDKERSKTKMLAIFGLSEVPSGEIDNLTRSCIKKKEKQDVSMETNKKPTSLRSVRIKSVADKKNELHQNSLPCNSSKSKFEKKCGDSQTQSAIQQDEITSTQKNQINPEKLQQNYKVNIVEDMKIILKKKTADNEDASRECVDSQSICENLSIIDRNEFKNESAIHAMDLSYGKCHELSGNVSVITEQTHSKNLNSTISECVNMPKLNEECLQGISLGKACYDRDEQDHRILKSKSDNSMDCMVHPNPSTLESIFEHAKTQPIAPRIDKDQEELVDNADINHCEEILRKSKSQILKSRFKVYSGESDKSEITRKKCIDLRNSSAESHTTPETFDHKEKNIENKIREDQFCDVYDSKCHMTRKFSDVKRGLKDKIKKRLKLNSSSEPKQVAKNKTSTSYRLARTCTNQLIHKVSTYFRKAKMQKYSREFLSSPVVNDIHGIPIKEKKGNKYVLRNRLQPLTQRSESLSKDSEEKSTQMNTFKTIISKARKTRHFVQEQKVLQLQKQSNSDPHDHCEKESKDVNIQKLTNDIPKVFTADSDENIIDSRSSYHSNTKALQLFPDFPRCSGIDRATKADATLTIIAETPVDVDKTNWFKDRKKRISSGNKCEDYPNTKTSLLTKNEFSRQNLSERPPRKSNILATQKIYETFMFENDINRKQNKKSKKHKNYSNKNLKRKCKNVDNVFCNKCCIKFRRLDNFLRHSLKTDHIMNCLDTKEIEENILSYLDNKWDSFLIEGNEIESFSYLSKTVSKEGFKENDIKVDSFKSDETKLSVVDSTDSKMSLLALAVNEIEKMEETNSKSLNVHECSVNDNLLTKCTLETKTLDTKKNLKFAIKESMNTDEALFFKCCEMLKDSVIPNDFQDISQNTPNIKKHALVINVSKANENNESGIAPAMGRTNLDLANESEQRLNISAIPETFEDKFDKIKRKSRTRAVASKPTSTDKHTEYTRKSSKSRKGPTKTTRTKKKHLRTKAQLKEFTDSWDVKEHFNNEPFSKSDSLTQIKQTDIYEFNDIEEDCQVDIKISINKTKKYFSHEKASPSSSSELDDFVYMSDADYMCSSDDAKHSPKIFEQKTYNANPKRSGKKNDVEKIYKKQRRHERCTKAFLTNKNSSKKKLDTLFDSLLLSHNNVSAVGGNVYDTEINKMPSYEVSKASTSKYTSDLFDEKSDYTLDDLTSKQRSRRKCAVGKQNVLVENWSSESEIYSNGLSVKDSKHKKKKKKSGSRKRHISPENESLSFGLTSQTSEDETEHTLVEQHGWIVGDSHKKLVTLLAHAKGRKRH